MDRVGEPRVFNKRDRNHPSDAVYIGRGRGGRWEEGYGNPFVIGRDGSREDVIRLFRSYAMDRLSNDRFWLDPLIDWGRGQPKSMVCWCTPLACHGDVLMRLCWTVIEERTGGEQKIETRPPDPAPDPTVGKGALLKRRR